MRYKKQMDQFVSKFRKLHPPEHLLRPGCEPFVRGGTEGSTVIVMIHGLSDSPKYMEQLANACPADLTAVVPLIPGHGLKDPDKAFEDDDLLRKWKDHVAAVVELVNAELNPDNIILVGYSNGAALSLNYALRGNRWDKVVGVVTLAAAMDMFSKDDLARWLPGAGWISKLLDGVYTPGKRFKYRYSRVSTFGGVQTTRIIDENTALASKAPLNIPLLAIHGLHDAVCPAEACMELVKKHAPLGVFVGLGLTSVSHEAFTLEKPFDCIDGSNAWFDLIASYIFMFVKQVSNT